MEIREFLPDRLDDVVAFERELRAQEADWGWEIDESYIESVKNSFADERFKHSISLLAYDGQNVIGRIDVTLIASHFDGSVKAYLDWICVLKSHRHKGAAQKLLQAVRVRLKDIGATDLIAIMASNDEALRFYRAISGALIRDSAIWISI